MVSPGPKDELPAEMRLGKVYIPNTRNKILLEETADWINQNMKTFEKIATKEGLILIGTSPHFRIMLDNERVIPVYEIHSIKAAIAAGGTMFKFVEEGKKQDGTLQ